MITSIVQFRLPDPITRKKAREIFSGTAPKYKGVDGLIRKYYILSKDGSTAGGVYLWDSQKNADRLYTDEWIGFVKSKYGVEPTITHFYSPVVVDNTNGEIVSDD